MTFTSACGHTTPGPHKTKFTNNTPTIYFNKLFRIIIYICSEGDEWAILKLSLARREYTSSEGFLPSLF